MMRRESQNIEWKESWRDDYFKWISGFANAQGGILFIGKDDEGEVEKMGTTGVGTVYILKGLNKGSLKRVEEI